MGNRLLWADALKGWLITFVVLGHAILDVYGDVCFDGKIRLFNIIYSFHMPAFMAVSGYFMRKPISNGGGIICVKRFKQLMIPFVAWSVVMFVYHDNYDMRSFAQYFVLSESSLWFLWALFWINIIFVISEWVSGISHLNEWLIHSLIAMVLLALMVLINIREFGFQFISYYYVFFLMGYAIKQRNLFKDISTPLVAFLIIVFSFLSWNFKMHELPDWLPIASPLLNTLLQNVYRGVTAVVAVVLIFGLANRTMSKKGWFNAMMARMGVISLGIYAVHCTFMQSIATMWMKVFSDMPPTLVIIVTFFTTCFFSAGVVLLLQRSVWLSKIFLGK